MKLLTRGLILAFCLPVLLTTVSARQTGYSAPVLGTQFLEIQPGETTVFVPQVLCPGSGLLTESGVTTNTVFGVTEAVTNSAIAYLNFTNNYAVGGTFSVSSATASGPNYTLKLFGSPPVNSDGAPLAGGQLQYNGSNQPTTYFALVTSGTLVGNFFTVVSNTATNLVIDPKGITIAPNAILVINLLPYWTLSSLFPSSMADVSFIPTTNPSNVMSEVVISPPSTLGNQQPQQVGQSYYFDASISNWVNAAAPGVPAGNAIVAPGAYVYFQNTSSNSYPVYEFISGSILTNQFNLYLASSTSNTVITYFGLPRNSSYTLSQIGFTAKNFTPSTSKTLLGRNDILILDNGHGDIGATYYNYKNQWYDDSNDAMPTDPTFPPGSVFGVVKQANKNGTQLLVNTYNETLTKGVPSASLFTGGTLTNGPSQAGSLNPPNLGGD